jgi:hypothetical protein
MPDWLTTNDIDVPYATPSGDAGLRLKNGLLALAIRSGGALAPCRVVATSSISLSTLQTIDGVTLVADDRVLVAGNDSDRTQNGVWVAASGAWTRPVDFGSGAIFTTGGLVVSILAGTVNAGRQFQIGVYSASGWVASGTGNLTVNVSNVGVGSYISPISPLTADLDCAGYALDFSGGGTIATDGYSGVAISGGLSDGSAGFWAIGGSNGAMYFDNGAITSDGSGNFWANNRIGVGGSNSSPNAYIHQTSGFSFDMNAIRSDGSGTMSFGSPALTINGGGITFPSGNVLYDNNPGLGWDGGNIFSNGSGNLSVASLAVGSATFNQNMSWLELDGEDLHIYYGLHVDQGSITSSNDGSGTLTASHLIAGDGYTGTVTTASLVGKTITITHGIITNVA